MNPTDSAAVRTAREYYNSDDADNFYFHIWGGEDIHVGWYTSSEQSIRDASRQTVIQMADRLDPQPTPQTRILDLGAGYGGAARYLAKRFGCHVTALNLSEAENERNRTLTKEAGLDQQIDVVDANFEQVPCEDETFDVVWSQDAILHSGARERVIEEVARVLKPGGQFIFTDPMAADDTPQENLQPILDRIHLESLGCPGFYRDTAGRHGLEFVKFDEAAELLAEHYRRVLQATERREADLRGLVSDEYVARMKRGLQHWIDAGGRKELTWGIFQFVKSAS